MLDLYVPPRKVTLADLSQLHLATCQDQIPHVSLMSYTYLPTGTPFSHRPTIIMTTPPSSRKTGYLLENPRVSLLVHDWVSSRPPTLASADGILSTSPESGSGRAASGLANLLYGINSAAMSRISVSINGTARLLDEGGTEAAWCKERHKAHNTFGDMPDNGDIFGSQEASGGAGCYIDDQALRVVVVDIKDGRISDWKGMVKDWAVGDNEQPSSSRGEQLVNGVTER
jgi:hypothetical protein